MKAGDSINAPESLNASIIHQESFNVGWYRIQYHINVNCVLYLDDILIFGSTEKDLAKNEQETETSERVLLNCE